MIAPYGAWDIETAPTEQALAIPYDVTTRKLPKLTKTGQYKTQADLGQWMEEDRAEWEVDRIRTFSFSPRTARIVAYSFGGNVGEPQCDTKTAIEPQNEKFIVEALLEHLGNARYEHIVGFNSKFFDWPFLALRALILNIDITKHFTFPEDIREMKSRYSKRHIDLYNVVNFDAYGPRSGTLDDWCQVFGIPAKTSAGGDIYTWVKQGNHKAIEEHCSGDRQRTALLWERVQAIA